MDDEEERQRVREELRAEGLDYVSEGYRRGLEAGLVRGPMTILIAPVGTPAPDITDVIDVDGPWELFWPRCPDTLPPDA